MLPTFSSVSLLRPAEKIGIAGAVTVSAAVLLAVYFCDPRTCVFLPKCVFHEVTGLYCPGCGNTRALHALLHGHVVQSLRCNLLLVPAALTVLLLLLRPRFAMARYTGWIIAGIVIVFAVLRNLPWAPFTLLAPPP